MPVIVSVCVTVWVKCISQGFRCIYMFSGGNICRCAWQSVYDCVWETPGQGLNTSNVFKVHVKHV